MSEEQRELLFDLLTKKAIYGLDEAEQRDLDDLDPGTAEIDLRSLEITAAAINLAGLSAEEPMPSHIRERILDASSQYVGAAGADTWTPSAVDATAGPGRAMSWLGWFGWMAAAAACIALAVNIWSTRFQTRDAEVAEVPPVEYPRLLTAAELRQEMLRSTPGLIKANWAPGNVKDIKHISGDVVWSDEKQTGYIRLRGLAVRTGPEYCYQLWIFDKVQDKATPIDGGIFDVTADGEIVIPINAKLRAVGPEMFAITIERHGGVVVSKREKLAAVAKVETQSS